ncbi:MAG TPA: hypothetical protein VJ836_05130 [Candidatus Saccharimonadales bacterium]|nr:hypothetical protein [Candidatus Saccharimonadales bacterium]
MTLTEVELNTMENQLKNYSVSRHDTIPNDTQFTVDTVETPLPYAPLAVANYTLSGPYVTYSDEPLLRDLSGTFDSGFSVTPDAVALGLDTIGNYLQGVEAGDGLTGGAVGEGLFAMLGIKAGDGIATNPGGVSVRLQPGGGIFHTGGGLSLSGACSDGQLLKWNTSADSWECSNDTSTGALVTRSADGATSISPATLMEFGPAASSSDEFIVSDQGGGTVRVRTGTAIPLVNAAATISGVWTFSSALNAGGGIVCTDCISLSTETSGNYLAGLLAGSGLSVSGSGSEAAMPTVSLDTSLSIFKTVDASLGTDPVADSLTDVLSLSSGDGVVVTGNAAADSITFSLNVAAGSGLTVDGGALSLLNTCSNGQYLAWTSSSSSWNCASLALAPPVFQTVTGDIGSATADIATDTLALLGGDGLASAASDATDTVTLAIDLASGSGLAFSSGALTLQSCADGQILKRISGSWACAIDAAGTSLATAYKQQLAGTDNVAIGSSLTPLLTNGSDTPESLGITVTAGNEIAFTATIEINTSTITGPVTYAVIRDDNHDNDCSTSAGDGTQVGGQITSFIGSITQSFAASIHFVDTSPAALTGYYQLCASTPIALGTTSVTDRSLMLQEVNL